MQKYIVSTNIIIAYALLFLSVLLMSPIFTGLININASAMYMLLILSTFLIVIYKYGIPLNAAFLSVCFTCIILTLALLTQSQVHFNRYILQSIGLLICFVIAKDFDLLSRLTRLLTLFAIVGVFFATIGFFYALSGGKPIFSFPNLDGRLNYVYLTTFTNAVYGNVIRSSFIYDEPGAFSFVLCFVVVLRELMHKRVLPSMLIMLGGLVTLSLAHILIFLLYIFSKIKFTIKGLIGLIFFIILSISLSKNILNSNQFEFFSSRFALNEDGELAGDNRSNQIENFKNIFSWNIFWGGDYQCHALPTKSCIDHGDISSSIVTPLYRGGVIQLALQILTHLFFIFLFIKNKKLFFSIFAMSLILLQRPFFSVIGYQFMIYLVFFVAYNKKNDVNHQIK
ncbi:hypothetical protein [Aeromonas sobria]|uniref:hypothetical protein n=1 Tax=Aeromonas sobria TaxID=646 RepID=UPI0012FEF62A|nr:hypothetical protein [Aeromonas sobria]